MGLDMTFAREVRAAIDRYLNRSVAFIAPEGGFFERLDAKAQPIEVGYRRALVQFRQIYTFVKLSEFDAELLRLANRGFLYTCNNFWDSEFGGWVFKTTPRGEPHDETKDTYTQAFSIFALAHLARATGDTEVHRWLEKSLEYVDRLKDSRRGGYVEATDREGHPLLRTRRQNPHMHLLEAFLAVERLGLDQAHRAREIYELLLERFTARGEPPLLEFFTDDWRPHPEQGEIVEPGHLYEWSWLLREYAALYSQPDALRIAEGLHTWADRFGHRDGDVVDEVTQGGSAKKLSRRIWPQLERLKSESLRAVSASAPALQEAWRQLQERFLREDGFWIEHRDAHGEVSVSELPGSTPYHLIFGLTECWRAASRAHP